MTICTRKESVYLHFSGTARRNGQFVVCMNFKIKCAGRSFYQISAKKQADYIKE